MLISIAAGRLRRHNSRIANHERGRDADVVVGQHGDLLALCVVGEPKVEPGLGDVDVEALDAAAVLQHTSQLCQCLQLCHTASSTMTKQSSQFTICVSI